MDKIRWIHLSDIHFSINNYKTQWLRDKLIESLEKEKGKIDILIITGDLLYQFSSTFDEIEKFLNSIIRAINISLDNVFIVPGNHDFGRTDTRKLILEGIKSNVECISKKVADLSSEVISILLDEQKEFWDFHKNFLKRNDDYKKVHFVNKRDKFNIINLNTCLISGLDNEEGSLSINMNQLIKTLRDKKDDNKVNIAIGHHSLECFTEKEQSQIVNIFEDYKIDLYFCGHIHKSKYKIYTDGKRYIPSIVCGSGMLDSYAEPSFVIGEINLDTAQGNIEYYKWSKNNNWLVNNEVTRHICDNGVLKFSLDRLYKLKKVDDYYNNQQSDELVAKKINQLTEVTLEHDKFEKFLISFCKEINHFSDNGHGQAEKDVEEKFVNMKCNSTFENQFNSNIEYFTLIDNILLNTEYIPYDRKIAIPGVIIDAYSLVVDCSNNGTKILNEMVNILISKYKNIYGVPNNDLRQYFKTIIFWSINKCDIYNEVK
ncbi:metallophosphoesterase family protein [Clostridium tyrobutyricum]|uniref:metallophosphoesterase family protein n=1 Tax=Clostridium tyrobutyricum TaxID=1519 RepID=UPI00189E43BA|nr:metallophosphoesterase [Clostridium tyrobutyricum]